nr:hypothetical protein CUMW_190200 [Ipomoea batatas]
MSVCTVKGGGVVFGPEGASGEGKNGEVLAVADLDHVTVGVVEEELIHNHAVFLNLSRHVLDFHVVEVFDDEIHVGALKRNVVRESLSSGEHQELRKPFRYVFPVMREARDQHFVVVQRERLRSELYVRGYFWMNLTAVVGRPSWGFRAAIVRSGRVLDGWERITVLRESKGLRFFSFSTALSRYGSRTHLTLAFTNVRTWRRSLAAMAVVRWRKAMVVNSSFTEPLFGTAKFGKLAAKQKHLFAK